MFVNKRLKEIKYRDKVIRTYLINRNWDEDMHHDDLPEFKLIRKVVITQKDLMIYGGLLRRYPYIYNYEYQAKFSTYKQKGDLLFTDGKENYLIVECKSIRYKAKGKRTEARKTLRDQVSKLMRIIRIQNQK